MNRLKHILGVNVPRITPNVALSTRCERSTGVHLRNDQFRSELSKADSLSRKCHYVGVKYSEQFCQDGTRFISKGSKIISKQRSKTKASVVMLRKKSSTDRRSSANSLARTLRHYSTYRNDKFNSDEIGSEAPRSTTGTPSDGLRFDNTIRRSRPFGTLSSPSLKEQIVNVAEFKSLDRRRIRRDDTNAVGCHDLERRDVRTVEITNGGNDRATSEDRSCAKLIADCSKLVNNISLANVTNGGLTPTRNVLAKNLLESFATLTTRKASSMNGRESSRWTKPSATSIERNIKRQASDEAIEKKNPGSRKHNYLNNEVSNESRFRNVTRTHVRSISHARKSTTETQSGTGMLKQSQVELRMVPSEKESVVSIDVDSISTGPLDPPNTSKQLAVVVRSDQKVEQSQSTEIQRDLPTFWQNSKGASQQQHVDYGPMRISISEKSAPVKRIEFSINGKPVSELRSITARTERLDVVSSSDKVEIRIPYAKDDALSAPAETRIEDDLSKRSDPGTEQVLNVQILANFQSQPAKGSADRSNKSETTNVVPTSPPQQTPKTRYVFEDTARFRAANLDSRQQQGFRVDGAIGRNLKEVIDGTGPKNSYAFQRETAKKLSSDKRVTTVPPSPEKKEEHDKDESSDPRIPSNTIPWWSSSDCFNKIRKKDDHSRPKSSDLNEKKAIRPSIKQDRVAETLFPKSQETNVSTNGATTNDSSDFISRTDLSVQRGESKPSTRPHLFGLKSNRQSPDTIFDIARNDPRNASGQTSTMKESGEETSSKTKPSPVVLSTSGTTNTQDGRDASVESDTHVEGASTSLPRKSKAGCDAPVLSSTGSQEEKHNNYPLKQTKSIDDEASTKSRIENILDAIKPIEKKADGTLIDYGLKVPSRKPTLNFKNSSSEELRVPKQSKDDTRRFSEESREKTDERKSPLDKLSTSRTTKPHLTLSKIGDRAVHDKPTDKTAITTTTTTITRQPEDNKSDNKIEAGNVKVKIATRNPTPPSPSQGHEEDRLRESKPGKDGENSSGSTGVTGTPSSPSGLTGCKSSSPKKSGIKSNYNYARQLLFTESSYVNLDRKDNTLSNLRPTIFETISRNLNNVDGGMEGRGSSLIGNVAPCTDVDRPEKSMLYSAWLQRSKKDVNNNEKLL